MAAVDRDSDVPLWSQVLDDLRSRLQSGEFAERFPTDREIMATYSVSRHTAREAVRHLDEEGLVARERGRGTFVRSATVEQPLGAIYSLFRSIEDQGFEQRSRVLTLEQRHDPEAAGTLELGPDEPLVFLERLRLIDGEPLAVDCSWLPAAVAEPLLEVDFRRAALYEQLAQLCDVRPSNGWERIGPQIPTEVQRKLLELAKGVPVFAIERLVRNGDGPIEWRHSVLRSDRFSFVARWSGTEVATAMEPTPESTS